MSDWKSDWWKLTLIGGGAGALGGLVGGGGDALIVPLLTLTKVFESYKLAIGTSLATLLPPVGIFAVFEYWRTKCKGKVKTTVPCVNWGYAMFFSFNVYFRFVGSVALCSRFRGAYIESYLWRVLNSIRRYNSY